MTELPNDTLVKKNKSWLRLLKYAVFAFSAVLFLYSLIIYAYASVNTDFAEMYTVTVSAFLRALLAKLTFIFPFSLAETIAVILIPLIIILLIRAIVLRYCYKEKGRILSLFFKLLCLVMTAATVFINTFAVCYKREELSAFLDIDTDSISKDDVVMTAYLCCTAASECVNDIDFRPDGSSIMPYDFDEMTRLIHESYKKILTEVPEKLSVKPVALSEVWTYTFVSGMYFPFTGESNVNVNFPDFVMAFTAAHEMAHQLGFAGEDEANMMAFLALYYSEDRYLQYSACMNGIDYLLPELDAGTARLLGQISHRCVLSEFSSYSAFLSKYRGRVSDISSEINDAYLKANGVENGEKSYNDVTKLICGFMKKVYGVYYEQNVIDVTE